MALAWTVNNAVTIPIDAPVLIAVHETARRLLSRIYPGVHHPSNVVAGWAAGLAWTTTGHAVILRGVVAWPALAPISK